jgi:putative transposase
VDEGRRREIGLFRYALIRDCADAALSKAQRGAMVRAVADSEHVGLDGRLVTVGRSIQPGGISELMYPFRG